MEQLGLTLLGLSFNLMYDLRNITINDSVLNFELNHPKGSVGRHLRKIGLEILGGARAMVGVRSGNLRRSLHMRQGLRGRVQYVTVGSNLRYAEAHHEGTRAHRITPRDGRVMRFNVGGTVVYARRIDHPGTKPRKYLTIPMTRAVK
jgi:hypothetical protein